jgi:hypothetical protein
MVHPLWVSCFDEPENRTEPKLPELIYLGFIVQVQFKWYYDSGWGSGSVPIVFNLNRPNNPKFNIIVYFDLAYECYNYVF